MKIWIEERVPLRERNRRATYVFNENTNQEKRTSKSIRRLSGVGTISSSTKYLLANAALKIQKVYRGFRDRQYTGLSLKVRKLQISARIIQRAFRNARTKLRDRHHADPVMAHVVLMKMSSKIDRKIGETCRVCAQVALQASRDALKAAHNALLHAEDTYQRKQRVEIVKRVTQYASFVSLIAAEVCISTFENHYFNSLTNSHFTSSLTNSHFTYHSNTHENANCTTRSWNITSINRAFSLFFLDYAMDRHDDNHRPQRHQQTKLWHTFVPVVNRSSHHNVYSMQLESQTLH